MFEASERGRTAHYKLTSTVMLALVTRGTINTAEKEREARRKGETALGGSMTRQIESDGPLAEPGAHISNIGRAIEDMEMKMRNLLQEVRALYWRTHFALIGWGDRCTLGRRGTWCMI